MTTGARFLFPPTSIAIPEHRIFGILGASGAGKSTFLKCLNWLIDLTPNLRIEGDVLWHSRSIFTPMTDIDALRARIGMIFQQPVVFPKSILDNVLFGVRHLRRIAPGEKLGLAETALREAALWNRFGLRLVTSGILVALGAAVWQFSHLTGNVAFIFGLSKENTSVPGANGFTLAGALRTPAFLGLRRSGRRVQHGLVRLGIVQRIGFERARV